MSADFDAKRDALVAAHLKPARERPPSTVRGVHHVALICSDVERTIAFYQDLLGFPLVDVRENRDYPGSTHFFFDLGHDNMLAFFDFPGYAMPPWMENARQSPAHRDLRRCRRLGAPEEPAR